MNRLLQDLRIVEISAFVAGPLGGMTLAQMGADVIRIDPIGGGIDFARWPVTGDGASLYWAGLNKAKRSLALALDKPEGREIARALVTAPGPGGGILLTNLPPPRGHDFASLKAARGDATRATGHARRSAPGATWRCRQPAGPVRCHRPGATLRKTLPPFITKTTR